MRVLVTGIGGAVGVHMFSAIMESTHWEVVGIDSFRHKGYSSRLSQVFEDNPGWRERYEHITHDLSAPIDRATLHKIGEVNFIINLASLSDVQASIDNPRPFVENNVSLILTMLEAARVLRPAAFIQFSTDEVYGPVEDETHPEWSPVLPSNPYAASKAAQEALAIAYWRSYGVPVIITNTMNNLGEMQDPSKFPAMIQSKIQAGEEISVHVNSAGEIGSRYYIHSRDVAEAVIFILNNTVPKLHDPGKVDRPDRYNIVGGSRVNNLELVNMISHIMDMPAKYRLVNFHADNPGHDIHYGLDGSKLAELGWKPSPVMQSLKSVVEWTDEHPEWQYTHPC